MARNRPEPRRGARLAASEAMRAVFVDTKRNVLIVEGSLITFLQCAINAEYRGAIDRSVADERIIEFRKKTTTMTTATARRRGRGERYRGEGEESAFAIRQAFHAAYKGRASRSIEGVVNGKFSVRERLYLGRLNRGLDKLRIFCHR